MKKRNFKQFFKDFCCSIIGFIIVALWPFLGAASMTYFKTDAPLYKKSILIGAFVLYTISLIIFFCIEDRKDKKKTMEAKKERLLELQNQYAYYVDLVNKQVENTLNNLDNDLLNSFHVDTNLKYLFSFEDYKNWICKHRIDGKPDSFIIASCLIYSIVDNPIIIKKEDIFIPDFISFSINIDIAMNCAFKIISEPITYFKDNEENWIEEQHPKVDIVIPDGIIKDNTLYHRILNSIYWDDSINHKTSIIQFSDLLHLIYLNCQ